MSWLPVHADGTTEFDRILGLRPELRDDFAAYEGLIRTGRLLDSGLLALCRVRVAQILGATAPAATADVTAVNITALEEWRSSTAFSDAERACLAFTEKFVLDPHGVSDADAAAVRAHLSPAEIVAFVQALAIYDGFTRFRLILAIDEES